MSDNAPTPQNKGNHYIFAGVGAVLGGIAGAGMAGVITAAPREQSRGPVRKSPSRRRRAQGQSFTSVLAKSLPL
jgi:hypothetical protein